MHKIYFNNKPLYLTSEITPQIDEYLHHEETIFIDELNFHTVKAMIHEMESEKITRGVFLHKNEEELLKAFQKKLPLVTAAGGFVCTADQEVLLIFRKGKWDLPKGKLEGNEDLATCAIREVTEETGVGHLKLIGPLCITWHTYHEFGRHILKESHWYTMQTKKQDTFKPQTEEGIEICEWVALDNLPAYLDNTHASIADVIKTGVAFIEKTQKT